MAGKSKARHTKAARPAHKKAGGSRKRVASRHTKRASRAPSARSEDFSGYSGKFTVRLPKSLHQALVNRADREGVSLNLFVTNALSRNVAMPGGRRK